MFGEHVSVKNTVRLRKGLDYLANLDFQAVPVSRSVIHPDFKKKPKLINDIALLLLQRPLRFNGKWGILHLKGMID